MATGAHLPHAVGWGVGVVVFGGDGRRRDRRGGDAVNIAVDIIRSKVKVGGKRSLMSVSCFSSLGTHALTPRVNDRQCINLTPSPP